MQDYGSCSLFYQLRDIPLRSDDPQTPEVVGEEEVDDGFVAPGSFIAVAAGEGTDTFWFMQVIYVNKSSPEEKVDDYGVRIAPGNLYLSGYFLEKDTIGRKDVSYKLVKNKVTYAYKESIVYPFVDFTMRGDQHVLSNDAYTDVLMWVEKNGFAHIQ